MSNTAFLYQAPTGVAGDVTRVDESNVEPAMLSLTVPPLKFGVPTKMVSGKLAKIEVGDVAASFYGILVREAPAQGGNANSGFEDTIPNPEQLNGVLVRGYINVKCTVGTPARNGTVYMRVVADTGKLIGDLEATSDSTNSVALVGVIWATDGKDADNNAEIRVAR